MLQPGSKRGRTHNAEGAREAILNAAEQVFAEHGFDGTRVDTIAEVAGYNKSLIFQYFGDKLNLYASVIRRMDDQIRGFQLQVLSELFNEEAIADLNRLKTAFRTFMTSYFDFLVAHPNFVRILNWEMAEGWQTYSRLTTERDTDDMTVLASALQKIQDSGWLRSNFNVTSQIMTALFTGHLYLGILPLLKVYVPQMAAQSEHELAQAREFLIDFILHGLVIDPE
jgi:AcrR family transcriptional regulator